MSAVVFAVAAAGCGAGSFTVPASQDATRSVLSGGGPTQVPPPSTVDGPAWFVYSPSNVSLTGPSPSMDFGALQNSVQGGIGIGTSRTAQLLVLNTSKKTALTLTNISVVGAAPGDFAVAAASAQAALNVPISVKQGGIGLPVTFTPTAEGVRSASLSLTSNAGTILVPLTGTGLPARPILVTNANGGMSFLPESAPATVTVSNAGGQTLTLQTIEFGGTNASSFGFTAANRGFGNCFNGMLLGPLSMCFLGVGIVAGAPVPSQANLRLVSNDPVQPVTKIHVTLTP
jgi:hypothetical protein